MDAVTIVRGFTGELSLDGRTVEGVVVPYDEPAEVADDHGPTPVYREVFTETSFARQLQGFAARPDLMKRVAFKLDHRPELDRQVGWTAAVTSTPTGLAARFGLYERDDLAMVRSMLAESHTGLSVECVLHRSRTRPDGVVERRTVELIGVAAVPVAAYTGAGITALRADSTRPVATPLLDAYAARWGFTD